jgi:lipopolysaccharide transport system ATP-binding protein
MLNGLIKPDTGRIEMRGRVGALIALGAGFNPILTGRENIYVNASVLGLSKSEIDAKVGEIIDFAEISEFIDSPVQTYSSGMQVRLGFAVATALDPDILILDEVLAVGDANFQSKCFQRIGKIVENCAVILVSHYPHHIKKMCDRAVYLEKGELIDVGKPDHILAIYNKRQSSACINEPLVLLGEAVKKASVENVTKNITHGSFLEFELVLELQEEIQCDQSYLNVVDASEIVHAQVVLSGLVKRIPVGITRHTVKIGPLHLSTGQYFGNLVLYGLSGKSTVAHLRNCLGFDFQGATNLGPVYYPPSEVISCISDDFRLNIPLKETNVI